MRVGKRGTESHGESGLLLLAEGHTSVEVAAAAGGTSGRIAFVAAFVIPLCETCTPDGNVQRTGVLALACARVSLVVLVQS